MYDSQVGKVQGYESSYQLKCKILKYTETQQVLRKIGKEEMYVPYTTTTAILVPDYSTTEFTKFMMAHNENNHVIVGSIQFVALIAYPISKPARVHYMTRTASIDHAHYFKFATVDIDEMIIAKMKNNDEINIEIVPYSKEQEYSV